MIITFYSYKGGVGRSMALANIATILNESEKLSVLMVDWDLEAPGLNRYFKAPTKEKPGVIDLIYEYKRRMAESAPNDEPNWPLFSLEPYLNNIPSKSKAKLQIINAGMLKSDFAKYAQKVKSFDWLDFYENWEGEAFFEWLRKEFNRIADIVLIDSRTGVTEMGGVCTYQLADVIVMLCGANKQNINGTLTMAQGFSRDKVKEARAGRDLPLLIIPARIERSESNFLEDFEEEFTNSFSLFTPESFIQNGDTYWDLNIPYVPRYAYHEVLAVNDDNPLSKDLVIPYSKIMSKMLEIKQDSQLLQKRRQPTGAIYTFRLTHIQKERSHHKVELRLFDDNRLVTSTTVNFEYELSSQDKNDIRWYLEDFLNYPLDPAPEIALRIEKRIKSIGEELFTRIFKPREVTKIENLLLSDISNARIEIIESPDSFGDIPWELIRDPITDTPLALNAKAFVRSYAKPAQIIYKPQPADKVRILLVICRPGGSTDVPFRSVSGQLVKGLADTAREHFEFDVLRPPTFEQLSKTLRNARASGRPYHIVHFDGRSGYLNPDKGKPTDFLRSLNPLLLSGPRDGAHGYLFFEHPNPDANNENSQLVDGPALGKLLAETDTPVLILNANYSAHAEIQEKPDVAKDMDESQSQVQAFGSLAQEVMNEGVAGVVAMRYNVYVVTAAQFVADLYAALASGQGLGEAVSMGRKQLAAQPLREIAFDPIPLQDWSVPVAYEAAPIQLFARSESAAPIKIDLSKNTRAEDNLPRPDVGFFGRDETILALDRAFDTQSVVLLNAYAGSGKTMTAAEFARWYAQTGGLNVGAQHAAPILFTSFEQYKPFTQILSTVEETYRSVLEQNNIQWLALSDEDRLNLTLQIFKQIPPLWIWDNVEPVNGFPAGTDSAWSLSEQRELRTFLQIVTAQSKTKFLLTSRRDEREWLGDIPKRVTLPPMPMQERVRLTRALADKQGKLIADVKDWLPLLRFTQGNPLTITVMVGQALRYGISSAMQIEEYLRKLRDGEQAFSNEASEGLSKSLGASLSYGFEKAFSEEERMPLALLHLFQGFVDVDALRIMVNPKNADWGLGMKSFTKETGIAILDKAADIGLLTAHGGGYYTIHPALPWFFRSLFEQYYPNEIPAPNHQPSTDNLRATRAYVESIGELGHYYMQQYEQGNRDVIAPLRAEEPNLLHARSLARQYAWWNMLIKTLQGLDTLYDHTGRRAEWKRLMEEVMPDFVGANDLPILGREEQWSILTQYRVRLAMEARDWAKAEHLQLVGVNWERKRTVTLLNRSSDLLNNDEKNSIRLLASSIEQLGHIKREQGKSECVNAYEEAAGLFRLIRSEMGEVDTAYNLGRAYTEIPAIRNLDLANKWFQQCLSFTPESDKLGKARTLNQLGNLSRERFRAMKQANEPEAKLLEYLTTAANYFHQALALLPPDAVDDLAITNNALGVMYQNAGDIERAVSYFNQAIHYAESGNNFYEAGTDRFNLAIMLANNGRLSDALLYAHAALRNFESYGGRAKDMEDQTKGLIGAIEKRLNRDL